MKGKLDDKFHHRKSQNRKRRFNREGSLVLDTPSLQDGSFDR